MLQRARPVLVLIALMWIVEIVDQIPIGEHGLQLDRFGIVPRRTEGLWGVLWAPFLHADFRHLAANTLPLFVLGWLANLGRRVPFALLTAEIAVLGGLATWAVADWGAQRVGIHVGASGLVFGYFGYVVARGLREFRIASLLGAVVAVLLYGGLVFGVLPDDPNVSWEGHLSGMIAGVLIATSSKTSRGAEGSERATQPRSR
jgi:membrane associated rhomboid family serine protease